jgi:hypothetical protein
VEMVFRGDGCRSLGTGTSVRREERVVMDMSYG